MWRSQIGHQAITKEIYYKEVELIPHQLRVVKLLAQFQEKEIIYIERNTDAKADKITGVTAPLTLLEGESLNVLVARRRLLTRLPDVLLES